MTRKTVLICGATGFIGRNLVERLASRPEYRVIGAWHARPPYEQPGVEWRRADLRNPVEVDALLQDVDVVLQAAASTSGSKDTVQTPHMHVTDNAIMNSVLLRAVFERSIRHFVFFSCSIMYQSSQRPVREDDFDPRAAILPQYFGGAWTKVYVEKICELYAGLGRTRFTLIRHSNIYGPYDKFDLHRSHVFGATMTKVLESAGQPIRVWGDGSESRDLLYVDDLVEFVELAIERQARPFELLNAGSGEAVPVSQLVEKIINASGESIEVSYDPSAPTLKISVCLDCARADEVLGWKPRIALDEGIRRTMAWRRGVLGAAGSVP